VQDAESLGNEEQVPDRIEERDRALNRGRGYGLALDSGKLVTQLGDTHLELLVALVELGEVLGGHVATGFVATDGLQHALALLAASLPRQPRTGDGLCSGRAPLERNFGSDGDLVTSRYDRVFGYGSGPQARRVSPGTRASCTQCACSPQ
jgi:hypothetical protein